MNEERLLAVCEILKALRLREGGIVDVMPYAEQIDKLSYADGVKTAANIVKSHNVIHGDHLAAYEAPSADAPELVRAILKLLD